MSYAQSKDEAAIARARTCANVPWCDDYEKMISGMLYDPFVPELVESRFRGQQFAHRYNSHFPDGATSQSVLADRQDMLRRALGSVGSDVCVEPPFAVDYGCNVSLGDGCSSNFGLVILDGAQVTIGKRTMLGPYVSIFTAGHGTDVQSRRDLVEFARPVTIGDDCWVGGRVVILPGVSIGRGCTVGAGSVVTRDIPDFSVAVGVPARVIKKVAEVPDL